MSYPTRRVCCLRIRNESVTSARRKTSCMPGASATFAGVARYSIRRRAMDATLGILAIEGRKCIKIMFRRECPGERGHVGAPGSAGMNKNPRDGRPRARQIRSLGSVPGTT